MAALKAAQVHRHRDTVLLYILPDEKGGGRTVALTTAQARDVGLALVEAAASQNFATKRWDNDV